MRQAQVRLYLDADVLGLAKVLAALRADVTYPGDPGVDVHKRRRPRCPVTTADTPDDVWIPEVSRRGWLIVTRDSRILDHRAELAAVRDNDGRMIALSGNEAGTVWVQLEVFMTQWRRIEALLGQAGPFIHTATRTTLRPVPLT